MISDGTTAPASPNGRQRLYESLLANTDRDRYNGASPRFCLFGQEAARLGINYRDEYVPVALGVHYGMRSTLALERIWEDASKPPYCANAERALQMARRELRARNPQPEVTA